jgi:cytochrome b6
LTKHSKTLRRPEASQWLAEWWRDRFDLRPFVELAAGKQVPVHRHSWIYLLGGAALFLFGVQIVTGCLLMLYYQPTEATAHASVQHIMRDVPYGWLVRSLHVWSANLFIGTVYLHFVTVLLAKSYRRPRELTWLTGIVLLFLSVGLGFSGYLLPWSELSFFATRVGAEIPGSLPLVGDYVKRILIGGDYVTGATITRFYAAHVVILPLTLAIVVGLHVAFVQLQGMSLPLGMPEKAVKDQEPFFSEFLLTDASVWLLLLGAAATLAVLIPAELGPKADALQQTPAGIKPEWYFLFVFQMLKYLPENVGLILLGLGVFCVIAVPFLDRRVGRGQRSPFFTAVYVLLLAAAILLQALAIISPSVKHVPESLAADTYVPVHNTVWLVLLWLLIGLVIYYLQQLRRHNRQIRSMAG